MRILLDTHAWLWFVLGDVSLSSRARTDIENVSNKKFVSAASYWEIAIKVSIGKYLLPEPFERFIHKAIEGQGFEILPILTNHAEMITRMPMYHRDPFDRILVAQALVEDVGVISSDTTLDAYGINRIW